MPLLLSLPEKLMFRGLNIGPAPMFDMLGGFSFYAVSAAVKLNLFEALDNKNASCEELALALDADARGIDILLEYLEPLGYVKKRGNAYSLTRMTRKWMLDSSDAKFKIAFEYYHPLITDMWPYLYESVKTGREHINFYKWLQDKPDTAERYQKFMMYLAGMIIPELTEKISLGKASVLDIGGSHGLYSIALCKKNPGINVTIIDSEYSMPLLKHNIESHGMSERIDVILGDFTEHVFKNTFDAILLFNVLHEHRAKENTGIIDKISSQINPGGRIIILDGMREKKMFQFADLGLRAYGLLFYHCLCGQNYSFNEIRGWLQSAGFKGVTRKNLYRSGFSIVTGWK